MRKGRKGRGERKGKGRRGSTKGMKESKKKFNFAIVQKRDDSHDQSAKILPKSNSRSLLI